VDKKEADSKMTVMVDENKQIDVEIYLDDNFKGIRYELTSQKEIDPLESAFILMIIAKGICAEAGVTLEEVFQDFLMHKEESGVQH
jgi:hypothetical protein